MSEAERPNPDEILARMKREETAATRGKLKIFFGMSPGVGKTYAMLQAARQKQTDGCEVVVGIVETHDRKETEALLEGMPIMPRTQIEYRGTMLTEMDLDGNLTALREMALRLVAEHVDRDLRDIMSEEKILGPWKSSDRLLVAVSASPYSERLIRYTRRLAASMEASWIVANIEQPRALSEKEQ